MALVKIRHASSSATSLRILHDALDPEVLDYWKSLVTGVNYPSGWQLKVNDPQFQVLLTLTPELKDQELVVYQSTGNSYWEGAVSILGTVQGKLCRVRAMSS